MGVKRNAEEAGISLISFDKDKISEDEAALYDRQIRLWGMECQKRLREAKLLVIGLNGVGAEIVKNLTLTGVKSITIIDDTELKPSDSTAQFFVSGNTSDTTKTRAAASADAIRELNPNVTITIETGDPNAKPNTFYTDFHAVIATDLPLDVSIKINKICRKHYIQFYCADTWGFYGFCFLDLQTHKYRSAVNFDKYKDDGAGDHKTEIDQTVNYCSLQPTLMAKVGEGLKKRVNKVFILLHIVNHFREMFNKCPSPETRENDIEELKKLRTIVCEKIGYDESKITDEILGCVFGELSPVCAAVGGIVVNEVIKGISRTGLPVYNYFLFDGNESVGVNETIICSEIKV